MDFSKLTSEVFVTSVGFGDGTLEISYLDPRDQSSEVQIARIMVVNVESNEQWEQLYFEIQSVLRDVIDEAFVSLRNPPKEFTPSFRDSLAKKMAEQESDSDD